MHGPVLGLRRTHTEIGHLFTEFINAAIVLLNVKITCITAEQIKCSLQQFFRFRSFAWKSQTDQRRGRLHPLSVSVLCLAGHIVFIRKGCRLKSRSGELCTWTCSVPATQSCYLQESQSQVAFSLNKGKSQRQNSAHGAPRSAISPPRQNRSCVIEHRFALTPGGNITVFHNVEFLLSVCVIRCEIPSC